MRSCPFRSARFNIPALFVKKAELIGGDRHLIGQVSVGGVVGRNDIHDKEQLHTVAGANEAYVVDARIFQE